MYHYLSECDAQKLKKSGFTFEKYEQTLELGRAYYFNHDYYVIGGEAALVDKIGYTRNDQMVAAGCWLPSDSHLWYWLQLNHIDVTLNWNHKEEVFHVCGIDCTNGKTYQGTNIDLLYALFKLVYKICKSGTHKFIPDPKGEIQLPEFHVFYEEMSKLVNAGFSFPDYEHELNGGMVYFFDQNTYIIGGPWQEKFTEHDKLVSKLGCWLPDDSQLWDWLYRNTFDVIYHWSDSDHCFFLSANDCITGQSYSARGEVLVHTLSELVYEICKSNRRCYTPERNLRLEILKE